MNDTCYPDGTQFTVGKRCCSWKQFVEQNGASTNTNHGTPARGTLLTGRLNTDLYS